ncbi:MAG: YigZ family protein [Desulfitobacteriia bacterium]|jgi:uncharacterized YigZ family protein
MNNYLTIAREASAEQTIEKSRFIALVFSVQTKEEAQKNLDQVKKDWPNARHYVYAYRLYKNKYEKASDDGEPQGTGGRPVLDHLQYNKIWDAQIIVVRYFGGILLGTGGLTRAYGSTARLALDKAGLVKMIPYVLYRLTVPYTWYGQIKHGLTQKGWQYDNEVFEENVTLEVRIPLEQQTYFEQWLDETTNKQVQREMIANIQGRETHKVDIHYNNS